MKQHKFRHKNFEYLNIEEIITQKTENKKLKKIEFIGFRVEEELFLKLKEKSNNNISDFIRGAIKEKLDKTT